LVLLILDEATSSVDTRTEVLVQHAMAALRKDRTSFVIAHRLSTIRDADLILVMENGQIVEQGSHVELLAKKGAYHALYHAQFEVKQTPQISSINFWAGSGGNTSEHGEDSAIVHTRAILDSHGRIMVLATHNTDFGDSFEREGDDPTYFYNFSVPGYSFGINALLYSMTH